MLELASPNPHRGLDRAQAAVRLLAAASPKNPLLRLQTVTYDTAGVKYVLDHHAQRLADLCE